MMNYADRPDVAWAPEGCTWAARRVDPTLIALALPEVGGVGGPFRRLTEPEREALAAWIAEQQRSHPGIHLHAQAGWDPREP